MLSSKVNINIYNYDNNKNTVVILEENFINYNYIFYQKLKLFIHFFMLFL